MEEKEIKIDIPAGYVIDEENSTFKRIKFKKKESRFGDYDGSYDITGFYINETSHIVKTVVKRYNESEDKAVFVSEGAAKSALAFAQITQIRKHETDRYGCLLCTDDSPFYIWANINTDSFIIAKFGIKFAPLYIYLGFDTEEHAKLFLKENTQLVKDYYMMD